uniref:Uncharacterized protein n=1 Tax=Arundo donax TaxID=35708 RepID=A0A0A9HAW4_ARUDO
MGMSELCKLGVTPWLHPAHKKSQTFVMRPLKHLIRLAWMVLQGLCATISNHVGHSPLVPTKHGDHYNKTGRIKGK